MAFKNYSVEEPSETEGMTSKFNEAFLKVHRIHELQKRINNCFVNPLAFNLELNTYNYEVIINDCNSLLAECWGKLTEEEKEENRKLMEAVEQLMNKYPIHEIHYDQINSKKDMHLVIDNWMIIKKWLSNYNLKIRELLSRTGYDSPNKDEFDEDDF